jgi:dTDP-4-dehydrorhamnose 3,5-epimerase
MLVKTTVIPGVLIVEPTVFSDARGFFYESFNERHFTELTGVQVHFVQSNHSKSSKNVLRGLHYQIQQPQEKLVRVIAGEVFDVAVDLRKSSATFGKWVGTILSAENKRQLWIPAGFAHGFLTISESADVLYNASAYWAPEYERTIFWADAAIGIDWPMTEAPLMSAKDKNGTLLADSQVFV